MAIKTKLLCRLNYITSITVVVTNTHATHAVCLDGIVAKSTTEESLPEYVEYVQICLFNGKKC